MYTGIVKAVLKVTELNDSEGLRSLTLDFTDPLLEQLEIGASVAIDGVCLSVVTIKGTAVSFDAMQETLAKTTLGQLRPGDTVNVERSAKQGAEVGGHILSGHIEGMARVSAIRTEPNNHIVSFAFPADWSDYIFHKGFIAINGASLTVFRESKENEFQVYFIPETLRSTTFANKKVGDRVNIEIDHQTKVIVNTVRNYLANQQAKA